MNFVSKLRTSFIVRCSAKEAGVIRKQAWREHRSVSGYLLYVLERSLWIEQRFGSGVPSGARFFPDSAIGAENPRDKRIAVHLRCSINEIARVRSAAARRGISINAFVLFSLRRYWRAVERVRGGVEFAGDVGREA